MSVLGIIFIWFANVLSSVFSNHFGLQTFDIGDLENYVKGFEGLYNIFAWVDKFVPVNVIITLVGLTAVFYSYKFTIGIIRFILPFFKK